MPASRRVAELDGGIGGRAALETASTHNPQRQEALTAASDNLGGLPQTKVAVAVVSC